MSLRRRARLSRELGRARRRPHNWLRFSAAPHIPARWYLGSAAHHERSPTDRVALVTAFRYGLVLCADSFGRVLAVDLATGVNTGARFDFQQGFVAQLSVSGDGRILAVIGGSSIALWRLDGSGPITHIVGQPGESAVGYDVAGSSLLVGRDDRARVLNPRDGNNIDDGTAFSSAVWSGLPGAIAGTSRTEPAACTTLCGTDASRAPPCTSTSSPCSQWRMP